MWRTIRMVAGVVLIGLGAIGTLMPVMPGVPLLIAGAALLGSNHPLVRSLAPWAKRWQSRLKRRRAPGSPTGPSNRLSHHERHGP